jgi:hypothetical protein
MNRTIDNQPQWTTVRVNQAAEEGNPAARDFLAE